MRKEIKDPNALFDAAEKKRGASKFLEAIPIYLEAKKLAPKDSELKAACSASLGDTYRMAGAFVKAVKCYKEAHRLSVILGDEMRGLDALVGLGLSLRALGSIKEAIAVFDGALAGYRKAKDEAGTAFTLWARAGALRIKGDLNGALGGFAEARGIFKRLRDQSGVGYCLTGLGGASRVAGFPKESGKHYAEANKLFTKHKDAFGVAYSYCGVANSLRMQGDFKASLAYFKKAKTQYKRIGDKVSYAYTLWGEGSSLLMLGKAELASEDFKEAARLFRETKDRRGLIYCELSRGQMQFKKNASKAAELVNKAFKEARSIGLGVEIAYAKEVLETMTRNPGALPLNLA
ncbi:MAG: tetratricopeptide repeat protein [Deltaproteobacteria bacterium]|nr:tetratricopeptide repeat protein [Deltaproteobacteria bacterium]